MIKEIEYFYVENVQHLQEVVLYLKKYAVYNMILYYYFVSVAESTGKRET